MLGACTDSVTAFRTSIEQSLGSYYVDATERQQVRDALLWRPLSQAVPCLGPGAVKDVRASDRLLRLQQALHERGARAFRAGFDSLQVARKDLRPGDVAIDYTYHEAWLLAAVGDTVRAVAHLDRSLQAMSTLGTFLESQPSQAAGLVRAMMLRARLAAARGDPGTATKWARAAGTLWAKGSISLRPDIAEMQGLAAQR